MKNKKSAITSQQIITLIIVIISAVIILFFYSIIPWGKESNRELCHTTVIMRATMPVGKDIIPLKCKTGKICLTKGKFLGNILGTEGKCNDIGEPFAGSSSKDIQKERINSKEEAEKILAEEMYNCWAMMGEGKINVFQNWPAEQLGTSTIKSSCVICSRIVFDKSLIESTEGKEPIIKIEDIDITAYLQENKIPQKEQTYLEYLSEGQHTYKRNLIDTQTSNDEKLNDALDSQGSKLGIESPKFTTNEEEAGEKENKDSREIAVLFYQIKSPTHWGSLRNVLIAAGIPMGASAITSPIRTAKIALSATFWKIALPIGAVIIGAQQLNVARNRAIAATYCIDDGTDKGDRNGCSTIALVDYNVEDIGKLCDLVESIS